MERLINTGKIIDKDFVKHVTFSRAVLWKNKEISLPPHVMKTIIEKKVENVVFIDVGKQKVWKAPLSKVVESSTLRVEGQEEQHYIPIEIFDKK
jgi:hypothetical protein